MRISDWSSDVCSSDLVMTRPVVGITTWKRGVSSVLGPGQPAHTLGVEYAAAVERAGATVVLLRSEGRRVGKGWGRTGRSRWSQTPYKQKKIRLERQPSHTHY